MHLQLIRSATIRFEYAGKRFIIDPYLAPKYILPSYTGKSFNPLIDLNNKVHEKEPKVYTQSDFRFFILV